MKRAVNDRVAHSRPLRVFSRVALKGVHRVYNLEVDGEHMYGVVSSGAVVQNMCAPKEIGPDDMIPKGISFDIANPKYRRFKNGDNILEYAFEGSEITVDWVSGKNALSMMSTTMTTRELSPGCERWTPGDPTKNPPNDKLFLEAVVNAGFVAFTHRGGLFGGQSDQRAVVIIHRGRGNKWEVVFQESDRDVVTTTTSTLEQLTITILSWLRGNSLTAEEDSLHAVAG